MITVIAVILSCAAGWLRGTKEGMIHVQSKDARWYDSPYATDGVKCHVWYQKSYHWIGGGKDALLVVCGAFYWMILSNTLLSGSMYVLGCLCAIWMCYELAYWWARDKHLIGKQERVIFVEPWVYIARGRQVVYLHIIRVSLVITFLMIGRLL